MNNFFNDYFGHLLMHVNVEIDVVFNIKYMNRLIPYIITVVSFLLPCSTVVATQPLMELCVQANELDSELLFQQDDDEIKDTDKYPIVFQNLNGAKIAKEQKRFATKDDVNVPLYPPIREGYEFTGWYTTKDYQQGTKVEEITIDLIPREGEDNNIKVYARWGEDGDGGLIDYIIEYHYENGVVNPNIRTVNFETPLNERELKPLTRRGYSFTSWHLDAELKSEPIEVISGQHIAYLDGKTLRLYAKWGDGFGEDGAGNNEGLIYYQIVYANSNFPNVYNPNALSNPDDIAITYSNNYPLNPLTRTGYEFLGWYTSPTFEEGTEITSYNQHIIDYADNDKQAVYFYARWDEATVYSIIYHNTNDVENPNITETTVEVSLDEIDDLILQPLVRRGYEFTGWFMDGNFSGEPVDRLNIDLMSYIENNELHIYAKWGDGTGDGLITYRINYILGVDAVNNPNENKVSYTVLEDNYVLLEPTANDYEFEMWSADKSSEDAVTIISPEILDLVHGEGHNHVINLYAHWNGVAINVFDIEYFNIDPKDNPNADFTKYVHGESIYKLKNPTKRGYEFSGWYIDPDFTTQITELNDEKAGMINHEAVIKLYAKWGDGTGDGLITYNIEYLNVQPSEHANQTTYNVTQGFVPLLNPKRSGYRFNGWLIDGNAKVISLSPSTITYYANSDYKVQIEATWSDMPNVYSISYRNLLDAYNPNKLKSFSVGDENLPYQLKPLSRRGYKFSGWFADKNFTIPVSEIEESLEQYVDNDNVLSIYAKWGNNGTDAIVYSIVYENLNGAELPRENREIASIDYGAFDLKDLNKPGYEFSGWFVKPDFQIPVSTISGDLIPYVDENETLYLYAKWGDGTGDGLIDYTISYYNTKGVENPNEDVIDYNVLYSDIELHSLNRLGYEFEGWYTEPSYINKYSSVCVDMASNAAYKGIINLYAKWSEPITYDIIYVNPLTISNSNPKEYNIEQDDYWLKPLSSAEGTFSGFFLDEDYREDVLALDSDLISYADENNQIFIYVRWKEISIETTYNIKYYNIKAADNPNRAYTLYDPSKQDYQLLNPADNGDVKFEGWFIGNSYGKMEQVYGIDHGVEKYADSHRTINLYAKWSGSVNTSHFIQWELADPSAINPNADITIYNEGTGPYMLEEATSPSNTFVDWYIIDNEGDKQVIYQIEDALFSDGEILLTIYAEWESMGSFSIFYDKWNLLAGAVNPNPDTYPAGQTLVLKEPSVPGLAFDGWYNSKNELVETLEGQDGDVFSLIARWRPVSDEFVAYPTMSDGNITIEATRPGSEVKVYNLMGTPVHSFKTVSAKAKYNLPIDINGYYILIEDNQNAFRIMIQK